MNFLVKSIAVLVIMSSMSVYGQDNPTPTPKPEPAPVIKIVGVGGGDKEPPPAPEHVIAGKMVKLQVTGHPADARFIWDILPLNIADIDVEKSVLRFTAKASPNPFYVRVWVITADKVVMLDHSVIIGDNSPNPIDPNPVDPVDPKPKENEFRVFILMEMDDLPTLSASQSAALNSGKFYDFLNEKTTKDKNGGVGWKYVDDDLSDAELAKMEPFWQETYKKAKADALAAGSNGKPLYPWAVFSNPAKPGIGEAGPFPVTPDQAMEKAKRWAP